MVGDITDGILLGADVIMAEEMDLVNTKGYIVNNNVRIPITGDESIYSARQVRGKEDVLRNSEVVKMISRNSALPCTMLITNDCRER